MKKTFVWLLFLVCGSAMAQTNHNSEVAKNLDIFNELYKELDLYYVDTLDANALVTTAIDDMLDKVDPYTTYYPKSRQKQLEELSNGMKYVGIGALIRYDAGSDRCCIDEPYENMPAYKVGLRAGDVILSIGDSIIPVRGTTPNGKYTSSVSSKLRGEPGTSFLLKVKRYGEKNPLQFTITRQTVAFPVITYCGMLSDSVGYIAFNQFTRNITRDLRRSIAGLKGRGAKRLVIDLRGNGGGSLGEAISLVNLFIPRGLTVVSTKSRIKNESETFKTTDEPWDTKIPLAVLVDGSSASAAEITAGALQDYDRAVVVGMRSFGKGLVQQTRELNHGATLKLTTSRYYIPSGRCVQALDYQHRNADGSPKALPESKSKTFYTTSGRPVKDGGGIIPDVAGKIDTLSNCLLALDSCQQLFDLANRYFYEHKKIDSPTQFALPDNQLKAMIDSIVTNGFTYENRSKRVIDLLKSTAKVDKVEADSSIVALEQLFKPNPRKELYNDLEGTRRIIETQIIRRYYNQEGQFEYLLKEDSTLKKALEVLSSDEKYSSLLKKK